MKKFLLILTISILFSACTTKFYNPNIKNPILQKEKLEEDKTLCRLYAYKQIPYKTIPNNGSFEFRNINTGDRYVGNFHRRLNLFSEEDMLRKKVFILCMKKKGWKIFKN